jgi:hypothetical protein
MMVVMTHNYAGKLMGGTPVAWRPFSIPRLAGSAAEQPVRVTVDGEDFEITTSPERPGQYHYDWISGPNAGYGFSSASSDGRPSTTDDHEEAIRNFLGQVDPETGYIE